MIIIKADGLDELIKDLSALSLKQVPYATALALTRTAQDVKAAQVAEMQKSLLEKRHKTRPRGNGFP